MIEAITMKNCATYSDSGATINNCQKINFFYGHNGSGKSTISNYLQEQSSAEYSDCQVKWTNNVPTEVIVYNKKFRSRHFKENIDGVFTLGEATIEEISALDALKVEYKKKTEEINTRKTSLQKKKEEKEGYINQYREVFWNEILKKNDDDFQNAFTGFRSNKDKFREHVLFQYNKSHFSNETRANLILRSNTLFSDKPEKCALFILDINSLCEEIKRIQIDDIWSKVIVGNKDVPIAKLIGFLDNADWVNKGREYIKSEQVCPFCQQETISTDFKNQLNSFFSGEYESDITKIKGLSIRYTELSSQIMDNIDSVLLNTSGIVVSKFDEDKYKALKSALSAVFSSSVAEMNSKLGEAGKKIVITDSTNLINEIMKVVTEANRIIEHHNKMVVNYIEKREKLIADIWAFLMQENNRIITEYIDKLAIFEKAENGIQGGINQYATQLNDLDKQILEADKNITSVKPTVDEINRSLKAYGFTNFLIVPSPLEKNSYQIQRKDGALATNTLSEGEETFISFLYFLQFAKGSIDVAKVSSKKILIIDDPICSLDSTVLYIVSSMVKTLIKDVRKENSDVEQLFILTHNVFFHKEASFVDGRTSELNDVHFWIISKDDNITTIFPYEKTNPIKTSYELLWQELKNNTNSSLVTVQNIMRRILENYFSILGKNVDDRIIESFETAEDQIICRSLISWINDGSHSIPDDFYIDSYTDSIDRYKKIFKQIFIQMDHKAHYDMMMSEK